MLYLNKTDDDPIWCQNRFHLFALFLILADWNLLNLMLVLCRYVLLTRNGSTYTCCGCTMLLKFFFQICDYFFFTYRLAVMPRSVLRMKTWCSRNATKPEWSGRTREKFPHHSKWGHPITTLLDTACVYPVVAAGGGGFSLLSRMKHRRFKKAFSDKVSKCFCPLPVVTGWENFITKLVVNTIHFQLPLKRKSNLHQTTRFRWIYTSTGSRPWWSWWLAAVDKETNTPWQDDSTNTGCRTPSQTRRTE